VTGNGNSMCPVKESIAALNIQRGHKIDKGDRCKEYTFLCSLVIDKIITCFYTRTMADAVGKFGCFWSSLNYCTNLIFVGLLNLLDVKK
jgi:hypothetical protein